MNRRKIVFVGVLFAVLWLLAAAVLVWVYIKSNGISIHDTYFRVSPPPAPPFK